MKPDPIAIEAHSFAYDETRKLLIKCGSLSILEVTQYYSGLYERAYDLLFCKAMKIEAV